MRHLNRTVRRTGAIGFPAAVMAAILLALFASRTANTQQPPILPDPKLTPGAVLPVTKDDICVPGYSKKVRDVPAAVKRQVYAEYGITSHKPREFEVDHLISLELGGSNSIKNLWPQSYLTQPWNAHVKDQLEDRLHELVCTGQLDLKQAQHDIASDWIAAYKKYFHTDQPLSLSRGRRSTRGRSGAGPMATSPAPAAATGQVWVNIRSGKYFHSGSRYFGKTKEGKYMSEADAVKAGYTAAKGQ